MPKRTDIHTILLIGSGPIVIGQACEFDYSGTQAVKTLKSLGYKVVLINSNPATIMTDPDFADKTYIEPITEEVIANIIKQERVDAILPTMGGQTALNVAMSMFEKGLLEGVTFLGANPAAIKKGEDRQAFKEAMIKIGMDLPKSRYAYTIEEAKAAAQEIGFPLIIRASYTLAGGGSGVAYNIEEFQAIAQNGLDVSPISEILIEESLLGWKEFEMEVIRDKNDNCIIVCSIENLDPMGVHTGDSITIAPALTLTDKEYQRMRDASFKILREIGVDTGGSNVQFAINPQNGRMTVIEMNPRVSRSSALASKATGYPIAKVATLLAVGFSLDEITNDITGTPASFEPSIDYIVTKIPRFTFEKFPNADSTLTTGMKSIGEVMAIGGSFKESLQKALCSLETGLYGFNRISTDIELIRREIRRPNASRLLYIAEGFGLGMSVEEVYELCKIDRWFLHQISEIVEAEKRITTAILSNATLMREIKSYGFSDKMIAHCLRENENLNLSEAEVYAARVALGVVHRYCEVDTCAGEFPSLTNYLYSTIGNYQVIEHSASGRQCDKIEQNLGDIAEDYSSSPLNFTQSLHSPTANLRMRESDSESQVDSESCHVEPIGETSHQSIAQSATQSRPLRGAEHWKKESSSAFSNAKLEADAAKQIPQGHTSDSVIPQGQKRGSPLDCRCNPSRVKSGGFLPLQDYIGVKGSEEGINLFLRKKEKENEKNADSESCEDSKDSTNTESNDLSRKDKPTESTQKTTQSKVLIIGGGPNRIGQGIEFDYCCVHASFALKDLGVQSIMYNCNPETVSTDYDTSDVLYFEPIDFEHVRSVVEREKPHGIIVHFGGQTPLKLAHSLQTINANIIGTSVKAIDIAEDREKFAAFVRELGLNQPQNGIAYEKEEAYEIASKIGFPVLVRPSYVLGGRAMRIVANIEELKSYMDEVIAVSDSSPVLIDKFLEQASELDVDCISDGERVYIGGIMEHIEEAGIHSGDSASSLPAINISQNLLEEITQTTAKIALKLGVVGLMNVQYAIFNGQLYLIEVNPRASRTVPFVSKATGVPLAKVATRVMWLKERGHSASGRQCDKIEQNLGDIAEDYSSSPLNFTQSLHSPTANLRMRESGAESHCHTERSEVSHTCVDSKDSIKMQNTESTDFKAAGFLGKNMQNLESQKPTQDCVSEVANIESEDVNAEVSLGKFSGCQARNEGVNKTLMTEIECEDSAKITKETTHGILEEALRFYDKYAKVDFSGEIFTPKMLNYVCIKESVFPFNKLPGADLLLGPEMKSTGEVMGMGENFGIAFAKSQLACKNALPQKGKIFISLRNDDKKHVLKLAKAFCEMGFEIVATTGTYRILQDSGIAATSVLKVSEGRPNILDSMRNNEIALAINTSDQHSGKEDALIIRTHIIKNAIPYCSTLSAAYAAIEAIRNAKSQNICEARSLQSYLSL